MKKIIILRGPAGAGKTTISRILQKKLNAVIVNYDKELWKRNLNYVKKEKCVPEENFFTVNKEIIKKINDNIITGNYIVIEQNFYHKTCLLDLSENIKGEVFIFTLEADVEECIERDKKRKGIGEEAVRDVHRMTSSFKHGIKIDTKNKNPEITADEIISYLK